MPEDHPGDKRQIQNLSTSLTLRLLLLNTSFFFLSLKMSDLIPSKAKTKPKPPQNSTGARPTHTLEHEEGSEVVNLPIFPLLLAEVSEKSPVGSTWNKWMGEGGV